jgi:hypothetical protein
VSKLRLFLALLAMMSVGTTAAQAQLLVAANTGWISENFANPTIRLPDGREVYCYRLQTEPGTRWKLELRAQGFYPEFSIRRGASASMAVDIRRTGGNLNFDAGGGEYMIRIASLGRTSQGYAPLIWLGIRREEGVGEKMLPPRPARTDA